MSAAAAQSGHKKL